MYYYKITYTAFLGISETLYVSLSQKLTLEIITNFLPYNASFTVEILQ